MGIAGNGRREGRSEDALFEMMYACSRWMMEMSASCDGSETGGRWDGCGRELRLRWLMGCRWWRVER